MPNITQLTRHYVNSHPSVQDCLKQGIINYSAASRTIANELGIAKSTAAILIALRRYREILKDETNEKKILAILRDSELEVRNKIAVVVIDKYIFSKSLLELQALAKKEGAPFHAVEGIRATTIITAEQYVSKIKQLFRASILLVSQDAVLITMKSTPEIERTPGVTAFVLSRLAQGNVNVLETLSCWTDTLFVIAESDLATAMQLLNFKQ